MFTLGFEKACQCNLRAYRLIFMDLNMPIMDGKEASKLILDKIKDKSQNFKSKLPYSMSQRNQDESSNILSCNLKEEDEESVSLESDDFSQD